LSSNTYINRYLHLQILLFRPLLSLLLFSEFQTISSYSDSDLRLWLPQAMALPCTKKCVFAAQQIIDLVFDNQTDDNDVDSIEPLPVWWYQVFCQYIHFSSNLHNYSCGFVVLVVYTAATALIPAIMYAHIRDDIPKSSLLTSWNRALYILSRLCPLSTSARRCLAALELLNDKIIPDINPEARAQSSRPEPTAHPGVVNGETDISIPTNISNTIGPPGPAMEIPSLTMPGSFPVLDQAQNFDFLFSMPTFEQDHMWLDSISLPTDLLNMGYGEFSDAYSGGG
jgi:hypothetical protein